MWDEDEQGTYDACQVCLNGHMITSSAHGRPEDCSKKCSECGEATTIKCEFCNTEIRGTYHGRGVVCGPDEVPNFCHECGKRYPWLDRKIEGICACINEMSELSEASRSSLKDVASDLVIETPKTQAATLRYKNALEQIAANNAESKEGAKLFATFLKSVSAFAVKESIKHWFGGGLGIAA